MKGLKEQMNKKYIVKNCPCYDYDYEECLNTFRDEYKKCYDCTNCLIKQIYEDVKTVYQTPEYFETIKDEQQLLIESAWHNVAHMVISKLEIEEVE